MPSTIEKEVNFVFYFIVSTKGQFLLFLVVWLYLPIGSSSLRPGTRGFTCGKWNIGYNFSIDDGTKLKFGTHKELIVLNILKYKYCVNMLRDTSRDHLLKIVNYWPIGNLFKEKNRAITFFLFILNISNTSPLEWPSNALQWKIMTKNIILNAQI